MRPLPAALLVWFSLTVSGCGDHPPPPIVPPSYDADAMSRAAIQQLDKNRNGTVEATELDACPGLKASLSSIDTNHDQKLSADELRARFAGYGSAGAVGYSVHVTLDGVPLPDATVTFTPEAFLGGVVGETTGRTGADGTARTFTVGGQDLPGIPPGVYRVAVTKDNVAIPARYNAQTMLGCEVSAGGRGGSANLDLKLATR